MNLKLILIIFFITFSSISAQFPRNQTIVAAEYFIDTDPGQGNGISIPLQPGQKELTIEVENLNVPVGSNIYLRVQSSNVTWSAPAAIQVKKYFSLSGAIIIYCEFYINEDPGWGNGIKVNIQKSQYIMSIIDNLKIKKGDRIFVRVKDSFNRWSPAVPVTFNFKKMYKAEYKIKFKNDGISQPDTMTLSSPNDSSSIFVATKNNIPWTPGDTVYVRFQTEDRFYSPWTYSPMNIVAIKNKSHKIPLTFSLYQNYPNPFNPNTAIRYQLPRTERVEITIYNTLGQKIRTLVKKLQLPGTYQVVWDGKDDKGNPVASGVYMYQIKAGDFVKARKMVLMR